MAFVGKGKRAVFYRLDEERVQTEDKAARLQTMEVTKVLEASFVKRIKRHLRAGRLSKVLQNDILHRIETAPVSWQSYAIQGFQTLRNLNHKLLRTSSRWYVSDSPQILKLDQTGSIMLACGKCLTEQVLERGAAAEKADGILEVSVREGRKNAAPGARVQLAQMCMETTFICGMLAYFNTSSCSQESVGRRLLVFDEAKKGVTCSKGLVANLDTVVVEVASMSKDYEMFLDREEEKLEESAAELQKRFPE